MGTRLEEISVERSAAGPSDAPDPAPRSMACAWALAALFAVGGLAAFWIDLPLSELALAHRLPSDLRKLLTLSEVFAHGMGVLMILVVVAVLDRARWRVLPRLAAAAYGAGILANLVKAVIARSRPHSTDLSGTVLETFHGWLPALWGPDAALIWNHSLQSFPSGHTATAVGLAIGLAWLYPQGRWLFYGLAALAACQRIESGAHFLSDTMFAAALATLWATACMRSRLFQRWERRAPVGQNAASQDGGDRSHPRAVVSAEPLEA